jgi:hypothetical protein
MGACRLFAVLGLVLTLGLTACGGDNDPSGEPPTTSPPEPADTRPSSPEEGNFPSDFVKKVDPVCVKALDDVDQLSAQQIDEQAELGELSGIYGDAATELEGFKPPEQNATAYQRFTDAFREGQDLAGQIEAEAGRGDNSVFQRVPGVIDEANTNIKDLASQYGFEECAGAD